MSHFDSVGAVQDSPPITRAGDLAALAAMRDVEDIPKRPRNKFKHQIEYRNVRSKETISFDKKEIQTVIEKENENEPVIFEYFDVRLTRDPIPKDQTSPRAATKLKEIGTGHPYIRILSPAVNNALRCVVDYYPSLDLTAEVVEVYSPYAVFFHFEKELDSYVDRLRDTSREIILPPDCPIRYAAEHITILRDWVKSQYQEKVDAERHLHTRGLATYDMLWLLYKPGDDIYCGDDEDSGEYDPHVFKEVESEMENGVMCNVIIKYWCMDANSRVVGPAQFNSSRQDRFAGSKDIVSLNHFPCKFANFLANVDQDGVHAIAQHFIERGRRWYNLRRRVGCHSFDGVTTSLPRRNVSGYIMVDPISYEMRHGEENSEATHERRYLLSTVEQPSSPIRICKCNRCEETYKYAVKPRFTGYSEINPLTQDSLTDHQYFLCNNMVEAFMLKTRSWEHLHVAGVKAAAFDVNMFDRLVLKHQTKELIRELVRIYIRDQNSLSLQDEKPYVKLSEVYKQKPETSTKTTWSADFIQGKGEGLTFLLHGKPGVGKTYTAECISHLTKRPLLTLTCADIGVSPKEIEGNLLRWFKMAERWGAIMLIDEADIYMEERQAGDIERNHLVAGFLRALEYFKGILFLTTNRVGVFDEAFISRVHVKLFYPDFNDEDREKVRGTFFDKLEEDRETSMRITQPAKDYIKSTDILDLKWNGREIRNAFQVAVALAESQEKRDDQGRVLIKSDHIKATVQMSREFREYLSSLHRADPSKRAFHKGVRYDNFQSSI